MKKKLSILIVFLALLLPNVAVAEVMTQEEPAIEFPTIELHGGFLDDDDGIPDDVDGFVNVQWSQFQEGEPTSPVEFIGVDAFTTTVIFPEPGRYSLKFTVRTGITDADGNIRTFGGGTDHMHVTVSPAEDKPISDEDLFEGWTNPRVSIREGHEIEIFMPE